MQIKEALTFDDVLLVPKYSDIESRSKIDVSVKMPKNFTFNHPIVPANMKTIIEYDMAEFFCKSGGLAFIHRFMSIEDQINIINKLNENCSEYNPMKHIGVSVGVKSEDKENISKFIGIGIEIICVDIAHGDSKMCIDMCKYISEKYPNILLIAGNVATASGAKNLWDAGVDIVKSSVGAGSICLTRIETGNGMPQLSAIMEIAEERKKIYRSYQYIDWNTKKEYKLDRQLGIISDGGHKITADVVKSLCFADMVMIGNMLAGTKETPGEILEIDGKKYKSYVGSSTHKNTNIEGVKAIVPIKNSAHDVIDKILQGVKSACSYQGVDNLNNLKKDPQFIRITNAGLKESNSHDVIVIKENE